jgi:hypothetical protein
MSTVIQQFNFIPSKRLSLFNNENEYENDDFYLEEFTINDKIPYKKYRICEKKIFHDWNDEKNVQYIYESNNLLHFLKAFYEKTNK